MAFTIPNEASAGFADQSEPDKVDFDILVAGMGGSGVATGCAVTAQGTPDMTVAVAAGQVTVAGTLATVTAGNVTITAADATNPRFDLITANNAGALAATAGTPAAAPEFPAIPANSVVLAAVYVPATDTTIATNQITDKRCLIMAGATIASMQLAADAPSSITTGLVNVTGLAVPLLSGKTYGFLAQILFRSATTTTGLKFGATFPAVTDVGINVDIPVAADGTAGTFHGWITSSGDSVIGTGVQAANTTYQGAVWGTIRPSANGTLQIQSGGEITVTPTVVKAFSNMIVWMMNPTP